MITIEEIVDFTKDFLKEDNIFPDTDIFSLGIYGDDMDEFLGSYHKKYNVNFDNYLWYFHNEEEIMIERNGRTVVYRMDRLVVYKHLDDT